MLTNPQKAILKRAQREAGLADADYRDALQTVAGCRSSTDPILTNRHLDKLLAYLEAIHWHAVDAGARAIDGQRIVEEVDRLGVRPRLAERDVDRLDGQRRRVDEGDADGQRSVLGKESAQFTTP